MKVQFIRRRKRNCAYPPIGRYISNVPFKGDFEDVELADGEFEPGPLRPDGNRQPYAEASVLQNLRARAQGRAAFPNADVRQGGWR